MLVLSRKSGQQVVIGEGIRITVVSVDGNRVKLGITAPPEVAVHREEIYLQIAGAAKNLGRRELAASR